MKIALCLPVYDTTKADFTYSALAMLARSAKDRPDLDFHLFMELGSRIEVARERLAGNALSASADWLFWLDDDHLFPPDALVRLLAHDLPFVGCNYPRRSRQGLDPTAKTGGRAVEPRARGLEAVDLLGFGVALTKAEMFKKLPRPWFKWGAQGEDGYFCEQAIKAGFVPHVDHALSMQVGHIAEAVLRF